MAAILTFDPNRPRATKAQPVQTRRPRRWNEIPDTQDVLANVQQLAQLNPLALVTVAALVTRLLITSKGAQ